MRVGVVVDQPDAREVVGLTLQQTGAVVESFASCGELMASLEAALPAHPPQIFLIDLAMPGEDGFETLRRVRSLEMARGLERPIPALALTAFTQVERERLLSAGFRDRVSKPVDADKLVSAIRAVLQGEPSGSDDQASGSDPRGGATASSERRSASMPR